MRASLPFTKRALTGAWPGFDFFGNHEPPGTLTEGCARKRSFDSRVLFWEMGDRLATNQFIPIKLIARSNVLSVSERFFSKFKNAPVGRYQTQRHRRRRFAFGQLALIKAWLPIVHRRGRTNLTSLVRFCTQPCRHKNSQWRGHSDLSHKRFVR